MIQKANRCCLFWDLRSFIPNLLENICNILHYSSFTAEKTDAVGLIRWRRNTINQRIFDRNGFKVRALAFQYLNISFQYIYSCWCWSIDTKCWVSPTFLMTYSKFLAEMYFSIYFPWIFLQTWATFETHLLNVHSNWNLNEEK